jgi:very-short-patch-repair endonuclease
MVKPEETIFNRPQYRGRRVQLRRNPTEPEKRFWQAVRGKQLGAKFRRQHGIGHYIVDFYCPEWALVVELDGDSHFNADTQASDAKRDAFLCGLGLRILRFTNLEIMQNLDGVLVRVMQSNPTPTLPLSGEGVKASAQEMEKREGTRSSTCKGQRLEGSNSSPCEGGGREGVAQGSTEVGDACANPTPTLPLSGEGANTHLDEGQNDERDNSSPCEGGGREGAVQSNKEVGNART